MSPRLAEVSLDLGTVRALYAGGLAAADLVREVYSRMAARPDAGVWTAIVPIEDALARADALDRGGRAGLPLFGVPFSVKDNIHVAGLPTTAGCPAFAQTPDRSATVVRRMEETGAVLVGKNTMDQFATGLVGIRSPVHPVNAFDATRIPGGSSSGSAVAVALGFVSIALGSDTGGSGRVPAALNNVVGFKPTPGKISMGGMIHANRSFDVVPILALTCDDAALVFDCLAGADPDDPFLQDDPRAMRPLPGLDGSLTVGVPGAADLDFDGDLATASGFRAALDRFRQAGARIVEVDWRPFREASTMVFGSPLLAERYAAVGRFIAQHRGDVDPVVAGIIEGAADYGAVDLLDAQYRLRTLQAEVERDMQRIDVLAVPTVPTIPTISSVRADPVVMNGRMGRFTTFANPLNLCAVAVPSAIRPDGLPFGLCLYARKNADLALLRIAARYEQCTDLPLGATGRRRTGR